jgi:hypothetical protein
MSDNNYIPSDDDGDDGQQSPAELREAAKRGHKWKAEAEAAKREVAFLRAGIDPEDTRLKYFVKGYDGPLEVEAIRSAAVEAKFIEAPQQPVDPEVQAAQQGQERVVAASAGTAPVNDQAGVMHSAQQAYAEGGLQGLSDYTQQFGITFNPEPVK